MNTETNRILDKEKIKDHIIHRHENILLDTIHIPNDQECSGKLEVNISKKDTLNRDIFLKEHKNNTIVLQIPILMEILALASIVVSGKLKENEMVVFAAITNFNQTHYYEADTMLEGSVNKLNAKNGFLKYEGLLRQDKTSIASGLMTAFFTNKNLKNTPEKTSFSIPNIKRIPIIKTNRHKHANMIIIDFLYISEPTIVGQYTYPKTHPLTKGHFPNNPIMMGVMQWMSIEDTLCAYLEKKNTKGIITWQCDANIYNHQTHKIADIKQITLKSWINEPNIPNQAEIQSTKRLNFRNMVKPNDSIYTVISNLNPL